ncbi:hypothetical protein GF374_03545 [Candidatus Woesearchaeota archaeon]|nr:hypothetical protein [Candidatus Woesearchaeota archaeon]
MTDITKLQDDVRELVERINDKHGHERPELISYMKVVEELGEITEVLLSAEIDSRKGGRRRREDVSEELGGEIADAVIALVSLANDFGIDASDFIDRKMQKHYKRLKEF